MFTIDELKKILRIRGMRFTKQREVVLEVFLKNREKHLSAYELFDLVKKKDKTVGIATIYRTIGLLEKFKLAYKIDFGDGVERYDIVDSREVHRHYNLIYIK